MSGTQAMIELEDAVPQVGSYTANLTDNHQTTEEEQGPPNSALIILCISCITFISCYLGGLVTVSVPQISEDLNLDPSIELWYQPNPSRPQADPKTNNPLKASLNVRLSNRLHSPNIWRHLRRNRQPKNFPNRLFVTEHLLHVLRTVRQRPPADLVPHHLRSGNFILSTFRYEYHQ